MRTIDPDVLAALEADRFTFFFLLYLGFTSALYLTDGDNIIYYDGETYSPRGIQFDAIKGNASLAVDSLDIDIDDTDQAISAILLSEDVRNKWGTIYLGVITETDVDPGEVTRTESTEAHWDAGTISVLVVEGDDLRLPATQRLQTHDGKNIKTNDGKQYYVRQLS
jgi:hypothetical protein